MSFQGIFGGAVLRTSMEALESEMENSIAEPSINDFSTLHILIHHTVVFHLQAKRVGYHSMHYIRTLFSFFLRPIHLPKAEKSFTQKVTSC